MSVAIRPSVDADAELVFALESDRVGADMLAFLPRAPGDRPAFDEAWNRYTTRPDIVYRIVEVDGTFAGYVLSFVIEEAGVPEREVGYWIDRGQWGRGVASAALALLLDEITERPLWGRVAGDNVGSRRVLEKAGFVRVSVQQTLSPRRGYLIDEIALRLD